MSGPRITLLLGLALLVASHAYAATDLGPMCWRIEGLLDIVRLNVTQEDDAILPMFHVSGFWRGFPNYQILGSGHATLSYPQGGAIDLSFVGMHQTSFFGGNKLCGFYARLDGSTLSGPIQWSCPGPVPATGGSTLTHLSCNPVAAQALRRTAGVGEGE
jgi:hypothetical protein